MAGPAYRIETQRLIVRCAEPGDAVALKQAIDESLDALRPWLPWALDEPSPLADHVGRLRGFRGRFDNDEDYLYLVFASADGALLGGTGLHLRRGEGVREIGYWLRSSAAGCGYMSEAAAALTRVAFEVDGVRRVEIRCDPENEASTAIPRRLGFTLEGTLRDDRVEADGQLRATHVYAHTRTSYGGSPCAGATLRAFDVLGERLL